MDISYRWTTLLKADHDVVLQNREIKRREHESFSLGTSSTGSGLSACSPPTRRPHSPLQRARTRSSLRGQIRPLLLLRSAPPPASLRSPVKFIVVDSPPPTSSRPQLCIVPVLLLDPLKPSLTGENSCASRSHRGHVTIAAIELLSLIGEIHRVLTTTA